LSKIHSISLTKLNTKFFSSLPNNNYHLVFGGQCRTLRLKPL